MRICKVYDGDYPWDVRVEKVVSSLVEHGHEVHLVCRNLLRRPEEEIHDGIHIHRLRAFRNGRLAQALTFPAFVNPVWISRISGVVRDHAISLMIARDLPLALAASAVGRWYGIPIILDMAENYPAMLQDIWKFESVSLSNIVLRNPLFARGVESIAIKTVDHLLVVIDEAKERLVRRGVKPEKISIVSNTPRLNGLEFPAERQDRDSQGSKLSLIFVGGLEPMRGLDAVLEMLPTTLRSIPSLRFTIVGGGKWERDLKKKVSTLGLDAHVVFAGRTDYRHALLEVSRSDIGIIPHRVTAHSNSTIPNKLFEYMLLGKPVVATEMAPVSRIIREVDCGVTYGDEKGFVSALLALQDPATRARLGQNGRRAVLEKYNWEQEFCALMNAIDTVSAKNRVLSEQ
jgi:glycosyltransferase involved in cell wall biosynthesis